MSVTVEKCIQAWTNSLRQLNAKADIVFFGDSLTYYGNFATVFPDKVVCNLGLRGDTIQGMINRVEQVKMLEPKQVFLMAGINDVASSCCGEINELYDNLIHLIKTCVNCDLIIQSVLPVNDVVYRITCNNKQINEINILIKEVANKYNCRYLDLYRLYSCEGILPLRNTIDGIHLKPSAYSIWYNRLNQFVHYECNSVFDKDVFS